MAVRGDAESEVSDEAVSWRKSVQAFNPWFAWPYALEAKYSTNKERAEPRYRHGLFLTRNRKDLQKIPKNETNAAVKGFTGRNLFLRRGALRKESSI